MMRSVPFALIAVLAVCIVNGCDCGSHPTPDGGIAPDGGSRPDGGDGGSGVDGGDAGATVYSLTLTFEPIAGATGHVALPPTAVSCDASCTVPVAESFQLLAVADPGYDFQGWSGDCADAGDSPTCSLSVARNTHVFAAFTPYNLMFTSSVTVVPGLLGGRAQADALCGALAADAGLPGTFHALIRTDENSALDVFLDAGARGWLRVDGNPFIDSLLDVEIDTPDRNQLGGRVFYPPRLDEQGNDLGDALVLTGSGDLGYGQGEGETCSDWTDAGNDGNDAVHAGTSAGGSFMWLAPYGVACNAVTHLYCMGSDYSAPVRPSTPTGRVAFLGRDFNPFTGVAAADALCNAQAAAAGLPGNYLALLSTLAQTASARFDVGGPTWQRPDGVAIVNTAADLSVQPDHWQASLSLTADGGYYGNWNVWTGGWAPTSPDQTCEDWTDAGSKAIEGIVGYSLSGGDFVDTYGCAFPQFVYCFQQ